MKKRIGAMLLVVVLALSLVPVSAAEVPQGNTAEWITVKGIEGGKILFNSATGEIEDCNIDVTSAEIPETINGVSVTGIGYNAFEDCINLTTVRMENSIKDIKIAAFQGCINLETVELSEDITSLASYILVTAKSFLT